MDPKVMLMQRAVDDLLTAQKAISQSIERLQRYADLLEYDGEPISNLGLSVRVYNALMKADIKNVELLWELIDDPARLSRIRMLGRKGVAEIAAALNLHPRKENVDSKD